MNSVVGCDRMPICHDVHEKFVAAVSKLLCYLNGHMLGSQINSIDRMGHTLEAVSDNALDWSGCVKADPQQTWPSLHKTARNSSLELEWNLSWLYQTAPTVASPETARLALLCPSRKVRPAAEHPKTDRECSCGHPSATRPNSSSPMLRQKETSAVRRPLWRHQHAVSALA